jgi:hypothetical protein
MTMENENIYDKIREILGETPANFNILEEKIDVDLQIEYFEFSKNIKKDLKKEEILIKKEDIFNMALSEKLRMTRFTELASLDTVEAYRTIERYLKSPLTSLRQWAILALQESRMLLESRLLDENQVFISTGLGGKGSKLRYFVVLLLKPGKEFSELNKKIVKNELEIILNKYKCEIENLSFTGKYATLMAIIPLQVPVQQIFRESVKECNLYGNFLKPNFIITNVKELSKAEIDEFLRNKRKTQQGDTDD